MQKKIFFDLPHLYYLPQFHPVADELIKRGVECRFLLYRDSQTPLLKKIANTLHHVWVDDQTHALAYYRKECPDWVIFGNSFSAAKEIGCPTALLFHSSGTSVKGASLLPSLASIDVRLVSGAGRLHIYEKLFPQQKMVTVGFAKLDPLFDKEGKTPTINLADIGLDPSKKTLLYSPTFYPSSIENMAKEWPAIFANCNIIIKAHDFTFSKSRYLPQRHLLEHWAQYDNVTLADPHEYSLLPFMATADLMISDASSAIFEFAALDKPVVVCDFVKLRWSYRGIFKFRLRRRLDETTKIYRGLAAHVEHFQDLESAVLSQLENPDLFGDLRRQYSEEIMGIRDGQCSRRIADYLLNGQQPEIHL